MTDCITLYLHHVYFERNNSEKTAQSYHILKFGLHHTSDSLTKTWKIVHFIFYFYYSGEGWCRLLHIFWKNQIQRTGAHSMP